MSWSFFPTDISGYQALSLRVGQLGDESTGGLRLQLRSGDVWSSEVRIDYHGTIPSPMDMCTQQAKASGCTSFQSYGHMGTVRIPLTAFGKQSSVDGVRVVIRGRSLDTEFLLDNLEFVAGSGVP